MRGSKCPIITIWRNSDPCPPINFFIVAIFKNSSPTFGKSCCKRPRDEKTQNLDEDDEKPLPHIFVYIAWFLCFAVSFGSAVAVFFYSLMWGKETADQWLSSILMYITMDVLAIQPVRLVVLAAVTAIIITKARSTKAKLSLKGRYVHCASIGCFVVIVWKS